MRSALEEERNRAAEQRRAAESAAYERSRKVLEEEIGKDRAWRRAVEGVRMSNVTLIAAVRVWHRPSERRLCRSAVC